MADFKIGLSKEFEYAMMKLDKLFDEVAPKMLQAGEQVVAAELRKTKFGKYVKVLKPEKNKYGDWFAQIQFKGTTSSGAPASLAATVYEFGRQGHNPQPARPEIRGTVANAKPDAQKAMENVLMEALNQL